jgi:hypothetical protein
MKTFTVHKDTFNEGIAVFLGDQGDYYIRLSNSSYPNTVRRYLSRVSSPKILNGFVHDLDFFYDQKRNLFFLCKPVNIENHKSIILLKHKSIKGLSKKSFIYKADDCLYVLICLNVGNKIYYSYEEDGSVFHYELFLGSDLKPKIRKIKNQYL